MEFLTWLEKVAAIVLDLIKNAMNLIGDIDKEAVENEWK